MGLPERWHIEAKTSALPRNFHIIITCKETLSCHNIIDSGRENEQYYAVSMQSSRITQVSLQLTELILEGRAFSCVGVCPPSAKPIRGSQITSYEYYE
jgi:hypothetical protein